MKTILLFGGGDAGGLIITEHGVRPIPPFDPGVRLTLKAASAAINAVAKDPSESSRRKLGKAAMSISNLAVEQVENVVGPLDADRAIVYQDDDGGFSCGSSGKPPIPIPWPPSASMPTVSDLLASGAIEPDVVELVQRVRDQGLSFIELFEKPKEVAKKLGVSISQKSEGDLQSLAPSRLDQIKDKPAREIFGFFQKVIEDGRFLNIWLDRPHEVARMLKIELSEPAMERLITRGAPEEFGLNLALPIEIKIGVVWAIACIVVGIAFGAKSRPIDEIVKDHSGIAKF